MGDLVGPDDVTAATEAVAAALEPADGRRRAVGRSGRDAALDLHGDPRPRRRLPLLVRRRSRPPLDGGHLGVGSRSDRPARRAGRLVALRWRAARHRRGVGGPARPGLASVRIGRPQRLGGHGSRRGAHPWSRHRRRSGRVLCPSRRRGRRASSAASSRGRQPTATPGRGCSGPTGGRPSAISRRRDGGVFTARPSPSGTARSPRSAGSRRPCLRLARSPGTEPGRPGSSRWRRPPASRSRLTQIRPVSSGCAPAEDDDRLDHGFHGFDLVRPDDVADQDLGAFAHDRSTGLDGVDPHARSVQLRRRRRW